MITEARQRINYVISDYILTNVAFLLFNIIRYYYLDLSLDGYASVYSFLCTRQVVIGQIFFPLMLLGIYYLSGYYNHIFFKSRLQEIICTFSTAFIGMLAIFFIAIINDDIPDRLQEYELMLILLMLLFVFVYISRFCITQVASHHIHQRIWSFNTLIIGTSPDAAKLEEKLRTAKKSMGFNIIGYVEPREREEKHNLNLPVYGIADISDTCQKHNIEKLIVIPDSQGINATLSLINKLLPLDMPIFISPDTYHLLTSRFRVSDIAGEPLIDISQADVNQSTVNIKRVSDIVASAITLLLISPILAAIAIAIKWESKGTIIYKQQRIGYHKKPFNIYKFRSMYIDAESNGPLLSSINDSRITPIGRFLRKYRLDELPQFWNVLKGDMSIVGPRPEREYYIKQILKKAPYYMLVHQVRPGITSWGMVKYGYATDVDGMVSRLWYDLIYLENISFLIDLKILFYTVRTVLTGKGI